MANFYLMPLKEIPVSDEDDIANVWYLNYEISLYFNM